ncbi:MAG: cupin domain-containing protein [Oligoflexia bacterium]|nr:cupin domain-containing protein [Oligoflexia bacterium]
MSDIFDNDSTINKIIKALNLKPHPEGGYFKESYRSPLKINDRHCSTAIYYLLDINSIAKFHIIKSDEIWHFYAGGAIKLVYFCADNNLHEVLMGSNVIAGETPQFMIPANTYFAAYPSEGSMYALLGCTVAPGFDYRDWELTPREKLLAKYPQHKKIIEKLT